MTKELAKATLINRYTKGAYTDNYIFGFVRDGFVWACMVENADNLLALLSYAEKRSTSGWTLRYRPTKAMQEIILAHSTETRILYSVEVMENEKVNHNNNRGTMFEDVCVKVWNGEQTKANLDFTKGGDTIINGIHYQIKFGCSKGAATFSNEKTLVNLGL